MCCAPGGFWGERCRGVKGVACAGGRVPWRRDCSESQAIRAATGTLGGSKVQAGDRT